jgi:hypothetical protein
MEFLAIESPIRLWHGKYGGARRESHRIYATTVQRDSLKRRDVALTSATVSVIVAILILANLPLQSLNHSSSQSALTSTTPTESSASTGHQMNETTLSASNYNSSLGLRLTLTILSDTVPRNDGISMRISLNNTLATQNDLPPPREGLGGFWAPTWNLQPCSTWPIGVEIFRGNYASGNLSMGIPLGLLGPNTPVNCATHPLSEIVFAPLSSNITYPVGWWVNQSSARAEYSGYWTGVVAGSNDAVFRSFEPGAYTIEGEDWFGQAAIVHVHVVPNSNPLDCATIVSNSSFVERTNFSASAGPLTLEKYYRELRNNDTVVLAFTTTGNSTLAVSNPYFNDGGPHIGSFLFSPDGTLIEQRYQYYSSDGILSNPIVVSYNQCSLVRLTLGSDLAGVPLLFRIGNQTQSFTLRP